MSSHSLHYQTGWLLYLPFTYLSWLYYVPQAVHICSCILLHTEGDDVRRVLNEKERQKKQESETKIHSHVTIVFHPCVYCLTWYIISHDTRLVWHSCLWDDIDIDLSFGSLDGKKRHRKLDEFSLIRYCKTTISLYITHKKSFSMQIHYHF